MFRLRWTSYQHLQIPVVAIGYGIQFRRKWFTTIPKLWQILWNRCLDLDCQKPSGAGFLFSSTFLVDCARCDPATKIKEIYMLNSFLTQHARKVASCFGWADLVVLSKFWNKRRRITWNGRTKSPFTSLHVEVALTSLEAHLYYTSILYVFGNRLHVTHRLQYFVPCLMPRIFFIVPPCATHFVVTLLRINICRHPFRNVWTQLSCWHCAPCMHNFWHHPYQQSGRDAPWQSTWWRKRNEDNEP